MKFRRLFELVNYDNIKKYSIYPDANGKKILDSNFPHNVMNILRTAGIKNPSIEESNDYYFITLDNRSYSDKLINIFKKEFYLSDIIFDKGKLTLVFMKNE